MKINIKQILQENGITDHLKRNYGKYIAGAPVAAVGATYAAGQGSLGDSMQNMVQTKGQEISGNIRDSIDNSYASGTILRSVGDVLSGHPLDAYQNITSQQRMNELNPANIAKETYADAVDKFTGNVE